MPTPRARPSTPRRTGPQRPAVDGEARFPDVFGPEVGQPAEAVDALTDVHDDEPLVTMPPSFDPDPTPHEAEPSDTFELPDPVVQREPGEEAPYKLPDPRVLRKGTAVVGGDPDAERIAPHAAERALRARGRGAPDRHRLGPARHALRAAARAGHQGLPRVRPARRPRLRARDHRAAHPRADPRQAGRRRRGAEPLAEHRHARRPHLGRPGPRLVAALGLARQGHRRPRRARRPLAHAAHADRRHDRLGQVGLHQRDALLDPAARDAGRGADDPRRPEEGRAQPLRDDPAPADARRHEHEARGRRAPEHRARDGDAATRSWAPTGRAT